MAKKHTGITPYGIAVVIVGFMLPVPIPKSNDSCSTLRWSEMDVQIIIGNENMRNKIPGLCYYTFGDPN